MQSNLPKISLILSTLFLLIAVSLLSYFLREVNNNVKESELAETELYGETLKRSEITILNNSVKKIVTERAELETHFARSSDIVPFLNTLEEMGKGVGALAEVSSVDVLKDSPGLLVGLKATGTFGSLYKFLMLLENAPKELQILSMDMHKDVGAETSLWNVQFKIKLLS